MNRNEIYKTYRCPVTVELDGHARRFNLFIAAPSAKQAALLVDYSIKDTLGNLHSECFILSRKTPTTKLGAEFTEYHSKQKIYDELNVELCGVTFTKKDTFNIHKEYVDAMSRHGNVQFHKYIDERKEHYPLLSSTIGDAIENSMIDCVVIECRK